MHMTIDPKIVHPTAGKMLVQIVEVLGGMTRGGIFLPGLHQDHAGKDTCLVRVLEKGGPPSVAYKRGSDGDVVEKVVGHWPEEYRPISVGDVVVMPRDMPLVFVFEDRRYGIVMEHEAIVAMPGDEFDQQGFEVVPWKPADPSGSTDTSVDHEMQNDLDLAEG